MPLYEYETIVPAGEKPHRFEVLQKMGDQPLKNDPKTGLPVRRVFSTFSPAGGNSAPSQSASAHPAGCGCCHAQPGGMCGLN